MEPPVTEKNFVTVQSTLPSLPYPLVSDRRHIKSGRLLIREHRASDLEALYELRRQPEVMAYTHKGVVDLDRAETQAWLVKKLAPQGNENFDFVIADADTDVLVGTGGCHLRAGKVGWPELGYMLRKEAQGKGYATEFVNAFLEAYWALPRMQTDVAVDVETIDRHENMGGAKECIVAITQARNKASHNVLRKTGWKLVKAFEEPDRFPKNDGDMVTLYVWTLTKSSKAATDCARKV
ncbi:hypothetical protein LMH87_009438 [Akanthomyces muscarius]|uniref:N-acetyltransferase domain-containing protein n=1 Tax=Akanthomyces muscarius TaxID=2231603 RepID=A0A9W8ULW3_AKAMU|nr:hypothetical protein LMH87_009438 [Akanthomyces muscarius]KAJ4152920.1 hypothetical protein LMH87_009438 [Akanthomyces muscarius]